ncbi:glutamate racemase [Clostridium formicaceticum]|uniref:Glutamate racemase n=1 Tax=Clostridium formicaceticum TaxID=1497 RepID=A0AAC9WFA3_9CLOT|nr:glutamate racemase [Clostridium formicaceticum]AOY78322.1 glutamate racemase [Clostridium formicaceticum]ARE86566.1 Glutamate racemase 2 [Clostridium formicaceticum]
MTIVESKEDLAIGVFDSGVGGISVLAQLICCLPKEKYVYYGDSKNAPYGVRSTEEVKELSFQVVNQLLKKGIKGLVVACNTATSGAIEDLRSKLNMPIVGMEPALKPAMALNKRGKIVVMATSVTLREKKFNRLIEALHNEEEVIKLPCPGLVEIIERTGGKGKEIQQYLKELYAPLNMKEIAAIVLGCTHYIFIKEEIAKLIEEPISIIDGNKGTANQLKRLLMEHQLLKKEEMNDFTEVVLMNSNHAGEINTLSKKLLEEQLSYLGWEGQLKYGNW